MVNLPECLGRLPLGASKSNALGLGAPDRSPPNSIAISVVQPLTRSRSRGDPDEFLCVGFLDERTSASGDIPLWKAHSLRLQHLANERTGHGGEDTTGIGSREACADEAELGLVHLVVQFQFVSGDFDPEVRGVVISAGIEEGASGARELAQMATPHARPKETQRVQARSS